jgi:glycerate dehydrogenase
MKPLAWGVILDLATIDRGDLDLSGLEGGCEQLEQHAQTRPEQVTERLADAVLAITNKVVLDRERLAAAPTLRLVCITATGTNNVDLEAARERAIAVCNVTGYATPSVVQHVFALILAHATRLLDYHKAVRDEAWARSDQFCLLDFPIAELAGRTLGIVGYGELGRAVGRMAEAFGMRVLIAQRPGGTPEPGRIPLDELLPQVDVLTLHTPLAANTRNLIGAAELAPMRPDALLVNAARGGIVDEAALAHALRRGIISGAAVDVLTVEPRRAGNPLLAPNVPNLIVTPHVAWASRAAHQRLIDEIAENIRAFTQGRARNRVV